MKSAIAVFVITGLLLLLGCSGGAVIEKVDPDTKIIAVGDSLTAGLGVSENESYPAELSKLLNCEITNFGVNGEDTTAALQRLPAILKKTTPNLVLLCYGGNDMLQKQPRERTKKNLDAMIQLIKETGADIVLIGVPQRGLTLSVPDLYEDLADEYRLPLEQKSIRSILRKPSLKSDMIHPNAAGYKLMADSLHELILKSSS
ncbi:arylesterase [Opitutia bacterium ISCC 51]|nr:arylesterase [Opitutae bacterium ISCC 51]QXD29226.1 arylesterase [Opitutae bacterium ISCC 52]